MKNHELPEMIRACIDHSSPVGPYNRDAIGAVCSLLPIARAICEYELGAPVPAAAVVMLCGIIMEEARALRAKKDAAGTSSE